MSTDPTQPGARGKGLADTIDRVTGRGQTSMRPGAGPSSGPSVERGQIIDDRYRIIEKLGEGGMGSVFKVEHTRMGKLMALKLLHRDFARDRAIIESFEQEAQIVSRLSCQNTVCVFDFGEIPEHGLYMAMEYVPGRNLGTLIEADGPFSERAAIGIAIQVLHSLAEAHDAGIIHRDIKPPNLMLLRTRDAKDFVKVLDFGIARLVGSGPAQSDGSFQGTADYAAPEQIRGQAVDARADLYALAATLFDLVTGRPPFVGATPVEVCVAQLTQAPPPPRTVLPSAEISPAFEAILLRALAKSPDERFPSADAMRAELESLGERYSTKLGVAQLKALRDAVPVDDSIAQRDDWDAFERDLRRSNRIRRFIALALAVLMLGALTAVAVVLVRSNRVAPVVQRAASTDEHEPNNSAAEANVVTPGHVIRGTIGPRLSDTDSDLDAFQFTVLEGAPRRARLRVSAVPNVNLAMELVAAKTSADRHVVYRTLARVDDQALNSTLPEALDDLVLAPGVYAVQLLDRRRVGEKEVTRPRENSTDRYELTVELEPDDPLFEEEPNDTQDDLQRAGIGPRPLARPVFGHTGLYAARETVAGGSASRWSDDEYVYTLGPAATRACALLLGVADTALSLTITPRPKIGTSAPAHATQHDHELASVCMPAKAELDVRVELGLGGTLDERYLLVVISDGEGGAAGAAVAADRLRQLGRKADATRLLSVARSLIR